MPVSFNDNNKSSAFQIKKEREIVSPNNLEHVEKKTGYNLTSVE